MLVAIPTVYIYIYIFICSFYIRYWVNDGTKYQTRAFEATVLRCHYKLQIKQIIKILFSV